MMKSLHTEERYNHLAYVNRLNSVNYRSDLAIVSQGGMGRILLGCEKVPINLLSSGCTEDVGVPGLTDAMGPYHVHMY